MNTTFAITLTPAMIGLGGAFLLGFGIGQTIVLNVMGLILGIGNVTLIPWLKHRQNEPSQ
jgi:hypothetical protein